MRTTAVLCILLAVLVRPGSCAHPWLQTAAQHNSQRPWLHAHDQQPTQPAADHQGTVAQSQAADRQQLRDSPITAPTADQPRRGSAWEPYLRGPPPPPPRPPLLALLWDTVKPWLVPSRLASHLRRVTLRSPSATAQTARDALRWRRGGDSGSGGSRARGAEPAGGGWGGGGGGGGGEPDDAMHGFNSSAMSELVPVDVAWMMAEEEANARHGKIVDNSTHAEFDVNIASSLAHLNSIAYCGHQNIAAWNCTRCNGTATGFKLYQMIDDVVWDLFAFVGHSPVLGAKVVAFRGTDSHSWYNWAENMRFWRSDFGLPFPGAEGALVHSGFFYSYNASSLKPNITEAARVLEGEYPDEPWYIIGHSMGSAMASICALDLKFTLGLEDVRVYTFGSPRVGNAQFATFFENSIQESFRITHNRDIVPSVPLQIMGFHHVPREVWVVTFDGGPTIIGLCDDSGEDPTCHNSVCYLGLCTSIADHMVYLGAHMYHRHPYGC